jgi:SNF2 family DNA or RNA helicase
LRSALAGSDREFFTQLLDLQVFPLESGGFAVSSLYDAPVLRGLRALRGRFHKHASAWEIRAPLQQLLDVLLEQAGVSSDYVFVHERSVVLEQLAAPPPSEVTIQVPALTPERGSGAANQDEDADEAGTGFLSVVLPEAQRCHIDSVELQASCAAAQLRDYQVAGVQHLASQEGACLGDDMGLGKTRQTVVASWLVASGAAPPGADGIPPRTSAAPRRSGRVLVLCPATLRVNWEREIHAVFPQHLVGIVGEDRQSMLHGCQWVVANYEKLGGLVRETALAFDVMVVDEAHYLKEHDSGRTRNAFLMAARIPRRYVVTGTPLLNREIELHTLLRLSGHRLGALPLAEFRKDFSGGRTQRAALAQALKGWMLRRRKDVLTDLGSKSRQVRYVSPAQGIATYKALYEDMSLPAMPKIVKLRQALEALKLQFLVEAIECRSVGDKFIVFCEFMATVGALKEALQAIGVRCVSLVGSDSAQARQRSIDAFQGDASVEVFIGTTSAAGVGITLTAANVVMFASLPWTPALMRQAEDRAYRLGQKRDVLVLVPLVPGTIDEPIWELLASKTALEQDVVEAVRTEVADPKATAGKPAGGQGEEAAPGWAKALLSRVGASPASMGQGHGTENRSTVA